MAAKTENIYFYWIRFMKKSYEMQNGKNKKMTIQKCHSNGIAVCEWKINRTKTCFTLVAPYLHTLHFTLFMMQRRVQPLAKTQPAWQKCLPQCVLLSAYESFILLIEWNVINIDAIATHWYIQFDRVYYIAYKI